MNTFKITRASEIKPRAIEWLWHPYIPYGKVTVLQGDAGDGKSTRLLKKGPFGANLTGSEPRQPHKIPNIPRGGRKTAQNGTSRLFPLLSPCLFRCQRRDPL